MDNTEEIVPLWYSPPALEAAAGILQSHLRAYGRPLLAGLSGDATPLQGAQALFGYPAPVLAHDGVDPGGDPGPRLIYANRAALTLWQRRWGEMVGLPSQLTAEPHERRSRRRALHSARTAVAITGYSGVRIDSQGRRFRIRGARLWTLWDAAGQPCGQAARFSDWHWL
ncbi:MEKHLA domain superfamily [Cyanobium sp. PCC 7001]|uniref:MEKHLA domain-containing protein n=1 Tax=Cyanobium sp. PCC 7001 TaxID=180281 RepID=UPI000180544F|nr:MEKHLA domain-containing protein [Cyanobium sp. PCC 7001]EDY37233.1 MEKHLA domain superfamily [Cyanobium sp. PCC 7001]